MLSENQAVACLAKITGRSYGAKYLGLCLVLQTGRSKGTKEKQTTFLQWQLGIMAWKWCFNEKKLDRLLRI